MADIKTVMAHGRIVWTVGNLFKGEGKTMYGTKQPKLDVAGKQATEYGFGLAIPKSDLADVSKGSKGEVWAAMHEEAFTLFPSHQIPPGFSMKKKDGDTDIDDKGVPYSKREGYAGCIIITCKTEIPIKYFIYENGQNFLVESGIKCGDYVSVQLAIKAHPAIGQGKAGLYINPMAVRLIAPGKEIINIPSADAIFGMAAPAMPQNYIAPVQPAGFIVPQAPVQPQYAPAPVQPHYGVVPPAHQPQQFPGMPPVPQFPGL